MNDEEQTIDTTFKKVPCSAITVGVRFSDAVFFDDGESMFLAPGKPAKEYHVECLTRWKIPFLCCLYPYKRSPSNTYSHHLQQSSQLFRRPPPTGR